MVSINEVDPQTKNHKNKKYKVSTTEVDPRFKIQKMFGLCLVSTTKVDPIICCQQPKLIPKLQIQKMFRLCMMSTTKIDPKMYDDNNQN